MIVGDIFTVIAAMLTLWGGGLQYRAQYFELSRIRGGKQKQGICLISMGRYKEEDVT